MKQPDARSTQRTHNNSLECLILLLAGGLLVAGLVLPVIQVKRFIFFSSETSLLGLTWQLLSGDDIFLGLVTGLFSVLFPILKWVLLCVLWIKHKGGHGAEHILKLLEWLGRWSMLDVLILALLVFSVKASGLGTAMTQPGLYCFAAAVLLSMWGSSLASARYRSDRIIFKGGVS